MAVLKAYRCKTCNNLLLKGTLVKGTTIEVMCKNKNTKDEHGKYKKCKTVMEFEGE